MTSRCDGSALTFDETLVLLLELLGRHVLIFISPAAGFVSFVTIEGTLERGVVDETWSEFYALSNDEAFRFSLTEEPGTGFVLSRSSFVRCEILRESDLAFCFHMGGISLIVAETEPV
jgi:hypothetical protein